MQTLNSLKQQNLTPLILALGNSLGEKLNGCPYIARSGSQYDLANDFLEDCYRGVWTLNLMKDVTIAGVVTLQFKTPARSSIVQYAHAAADVIAWATTVSRPGKPITIQNFDEDKLISYRSMMTSGAWSVEGGELAQSTIENRMMVAISMAEWAHVNGYRLATDFKRNLTPSGKIRYALLRMETRFDRFPIPSSNYAVKFLRSTMSNPSYFLCATTIVMTGLRISEACGLDLSDIPFEKLNDPAWMGEAIDILGKGQVVRPVSFFRPLIETMYSYVQHERPRLLKACAERYGQDSEIYNDAEKALILNAHGRRLAKRSTWAAFAKFGKLVNLCVHPHLLRHWYAANRLRHMHNQLLAGNPSATRGEARENLQIVIGSIQKELGHKNVETTLIYLESYFDELSQRDKMMIQQDIMKELES